MSLDDAVHRGSETDVPHFSDPWFRTLAESSATAIFVYDLDRLLYVNPAAAELSGYPIETLLEMGPDALLFDEDREASRARRAERLAGDRLPQRAEIRLRHNDGSERWVDLATGTIPHDGKPVCLATATDITPRIRAEAALRESRERLELAQRAGHSVVWEWDLVTDRMELSHFAAGFYEIPADQLPRTGEAMRRFIVEADREPMTQAIARAVRDAVPYVTEHRIVTPTGAVRWLGVRGQALRDDSGRVTKVIGVSVDITRTKNIEEALHQEKEEAQITLAAIGDGVVRVDADGLVHYMNPAAERLCGISLAEAVGRPLELVYRVLDEATRSPRAPRPDHVEEAGPQGARILVRADGAELAVRDNAAWIRDRSGGRRGMVVIFKDVSLQRGIEREMSYLAAHDPLTGLRNRREFERLVRQGVAEAREHGRHAVLLFIDLDDFKAVNDSCGHLAGDELLRQLATLLSSLLRDRDVLARVGGDEFGVLLTDCTTAAGARVAEKLCAAVRAFRFEWSSRVFEIGASIGLVPITGSSGGLRDLLAAADAALYLAKEQGRNRVEIGVFNGTRGDGGEHVLLRQLHEALKAGTLCLYGQQLARIAGGGPELVEVFVRLPNGATQPLAAADFVPLAERHHLMPELDRFVVAKLIETLQARDLPEGCRYSVNISGQSLADASFRDAMLVLLDGQPRVASRLCLELAESTVLSQLPVTRTFVDAVRRRGVRFVLDDVGSALAAFAYLRNLPVDFLKIDGGFFAQIVDEPVLREVVLATNRIGHSIGAATVGERVEDAAALAAVRDLGVDYAQGFAIGHPEPLEALLDRG